MTAITSKNSKVNWHSELLKQQVIWRYPGLGPHIAFILNNNHSDFYMNVDHLVRTPALTKSVCSALFQAINSKQKIKPDWVITYPPFGLQIGFCLAELFNCKFGYIESLTEANIYFDLQPEETVLLCADDLNTGTCMQKVINPVKDKGAKIIDLIAVIGNYSGKEKFNNMDIVSLIAEKTNVWQPANCPLCADGSQALSAKEHWMQFIKSTQEDRAVK